MGPCNFVFGRSEVSPPRVVVVGDLKRCAAVLNCRNEVRYMLIRIGYDIALGLFNPSTIVFLLRVHSSRESRLVGAENFRIEPELEVEDYLDGFGNRCGRVNAPAGTIRFLNHAIVRDSGDARHNQRRIGRIVIGRGRDAVDVPITMVFGSHQLEKFSVVTEELKLNDSVNPGMRSSCLQELIAEAN